MLQLSTTALSILISTSLFTQIAVAQTTSIDSVQSLGKVENPDRNTLIRDGGASAKVNGGVLWTFADTIFNPASVSGKTGYSSTAARASLSAVSVLSEPLDANNAPYEFIPLSTSDEDYNVNNGAANDRYAYWPYQVEAIDNSQNALVYYRRLKIEPGYLNYTFLNSGIAKVTGSSTTATVVTPTLFTPLGGEKLFQTPGFKKNGYIYLLDCKSEGCALARVTETGALDVNQYRFWNGSTWVNSRVAAAYVLPNGSSVSYSAYLKKYVMLSTKFQQSGIYMRTASTLTDQWSEEQQIFNAPDDIYAIRYHAHLDQNGGQSLMMTYYQPQDTTDRGMQLLRVNLSQNEAGDTESVTVPGVPNTGNRISKSLLQLIAGIFAVGAAGTFMILRLFRHRRM